MENFKNVYIYYPTRELLAKARNYLKIKSKYYTDYDINTCDMKVCYIDEEHGEYWKRSFNIMGMSESEIENEVDNCVRDIAENVYKYRLKKRKEEETIMSDWLNKEAYTLHGIKCGSVIIPAAYKLFNKEEETMKKIGKHCSLISELAKATDAEYSIDCGYGVESKIRLTIEDNPRNLTRNLDAFIREFSTTIDKSDIVDVKTYADRVVVVKFADGTYTKCEVQGADQFNEDVGIAYCLFKKALGEKGHDKFNDLLRHAHKVKDRNEKLAKEKEQKKLEREQKKAEMEEKAEAVSKKAREESMDILKKAIVAALDEHEKGCMVQAEEE